MTQTITREILETTNSQRGVEGDGRGGRREGSCDHPMPRGFIYNSKVHNTRFLNDLSVILDVSLSFKFSGGVSRTRSMRQKNCPIIIEPSPKFPALLPVVRIKTVSNVTQPKKRTAKILIYLGRNPGIVATMATT